jgi:formylglycine-generating enzyme required for sulfatase activity
VKPDVKPGEKPGDQLTIPLGGGLDMKFAWIPPGVFQMGCPPGEGGLENERPQHRVTLSNGFYLGVHEVTQAQWRAVMPSNPSHFKGDDRPVENVSWDDCQEFCKRLGERTGKRFRLPTEAEWEYACRAGTTSEYHSGNGEEALQRVGWYRANSDQQTQAVGKLAANAWGLHDMHGNVWEWCADWYGAYPKNDQKDPQGCSNGDARVLRGGSWGFEPRCCRAACRGGSAPGGRYSYIGCRVCLCLD